MKKISKGVALTIFAVVTIIAIIIMFCSIDYGYRGFLLSGMIMLINFVLMIAWAKQYDKIKTEINLPTCDSITEEVEFWIRQYPNDSYLNKEEKEKLVSDAKIANYGCIIAKAARYLFLIKKNYDYRVEDLFHYPRPQWNLLALGCIHIHILHGYALTSNRCIEKITPADIHELFHLFIFGDEKDL